MPTPTYLPGSSLPSLLLTLLLGLSGAQDQETIQVLQPKNSMSVEERQEVTLNCTVPGIPPAGPVKWFKGKGLQRQEIYNFKGDFFPRIKAADLSASNKDFSIRISKITAEDSGTYYCVKFKKGNPDTELKSGGGTKLTVTVKPSIPLVSSLSGRINPNQTVTLTCLAMRFFPRNITLKWFKNGNELSAHRTRIVPVGDSITYNVTSDVQMFLTAKDILSQVTCEVTHSTLQNPLHGTKNLSDHLRVPPEVTISTKSVVLNLTKVTCHMKRFYPQSMMVTWQENGFLSKGNETSLLQRNNDGTYTQDSSILVNTFVQKEDSVIICQMKHDLEPPVSVSKIIRTSFYPDALRKHCETSEKEEEITSKSESILCNLSLATLGGGSGLSQATEYFIMSLLGMKVLFLLSLSTIYILKKHRIKKVEVKNRDTDAFSKSGLLTLTPGF
ncbi:signal-regulatory protein beta-1-like [Dromiciops gliroides]|uniref:signal-regulatory protein beta-1-like n=1 Tax=Dromiciops gliroides TaxID=33562 RepID=UPI001CC53003|nr:signal-regulatory protein beta-1-like [Dromiciops gliroides]